MTGSFVNIMWVIGHTMRDKKIRKLLKKIRKLSWHQKIELMDWFNSWYSAVKEAEE